MNDTFNRFAGICALILGIGSILYAVLFLIVGKEQGDFGKTGSWIVLAINGLLASAAYVGLYLKTRRAAEGFALWGLLLGLAQSAGTMANGVFQATLGTSVQTGDPFARGALSQVDPKGLATFMIFGVCSLIFGWVITQTGVLPKRLGYIGIFNAILLALLFVGNVFNSVPLILGPGGLTALVVTPIWWIWVGRELSKGEQGAMNESHATSRAKFADAA